MYISRLAELNKERGKYNQLQAAKDMEKCMLGTTCDHIKDLTYDDQKMIHNLKYFTWVEQQGKTYEEINQLWYDRNFWSNIFKQPAKWDEQIREFNEMTGLLKKL